MLLPGTKADCIGPTIFAVIVLSHCTRIGLIIVYNLFVKAIGQNLSGEFAFSVLGPNTIKVCLSYFNIEPCFKKSLMLAQTSLISYNWVSTP